MLLLGLSACAVRTLAPGPPRRADPAMVLASLRAHEEHIITLRARFSSTARNQEGSHTTTGVLLVHKPDRFRMRLMLPIGLTVFDYLRTGDRTQMVLPLEGRVITDPKGDQPGLFSQADLVAAFLRGPDAFPGTCDPSAAADGTVEVICRDGAGTVRRRLTVHNPAATIRDETSYESDRPRLITRYDDYRVTDGLPLPYQIIMQYPGHDVAVEITIQRYEVNPTLADELFQPAEP